MILNDFFANGESYSCPFIFFMGMQALKHFENTVLIAWIEAYAIIRTINFQNALPPVPNASGGYVTPSPK